MNRVSDTKLGTLRLAFYSNLNIYKKKCMN